MKSYRTSLFLFSLFFLGASEGTELLNAQPSLIHLSLQSKTSSVVAAPVTVTWCSDNNSGKQYVKYGLKPDTRKTVKAVKSDLHGKMVLAADIKKLKSGKRYFYKCGSDKEGWSQLYSFASEPDTGTLRVAVIGDTQNNTKNESFQETKIITDLVRSYAPSLTLHMGDIVNDGSDTESWQNFLSVTQDLNAISPLMPVLGNHDIENKSGADFQKPFQDYYSLFNLPGDEINYSFTYMNVRFIGVFSGCAQTAAVTGQVKYKPGSLEYAWLDSALNEAEKDKDIKWIIIWMHYPVNSFGWSNIAEWKDNILPLIGKHRVDLCLSGHRHVYERHLQMKNGRTARNVSGQPLSAGNGTVYITNGTAGGTPTGPGGKDIPTMAFTPDNTIYSFAIMDINADSLTYTVFDQDNTLVDKFVLKK